MSFIMRILSRRLFLFLVLSIKDDHLKFMKSLCSAKISYNQGSVKGIPCIFEINYYDYL